MGDKGKIYYVGVWGRGEECGVAWEERMYVVMVYKGQGKEGKKGGREKGKGTSRKRR